MAKSTKKAEATDTPVTEAPAPYDPWEDKVPFMIPKDRNKKGDVLVSVNDRDFLIKRGVPVDLPRPVYDVLVDQMMAEEQRDAYIEENISAE